MPLKPIEVPAKDRFDEGVAGIAKKFEVIDHRAASVGYDGRRLHVILMGRGDRQGLLDALRGLLGWSDRT